MAEFKMAAIIKLSQNEWVNFFCSNGGNQSWQVWVSLRGIQDGRIQDGRIQDGCHHQVKWEWMILSQIELVSVRVRVEGACFWVNLREDNKVSESKLAVAESNMAEFKMAASSSWVRMNEWSFLCTMAESMMADFKIAAIIKLSENEWVWVRVLCKIPESKMAEFTMEECKMVPIMKFS